jgi:hypothetical protein
VLLVAGVCIPAGAWWFIDALARALPTVLGASPISDVAWAAVGTALRDLLLIMVVAWELALLAAMAYTIPEPAPVRAASSGRVKTILAVGALVVSAAVPATAGATALVANPHNLLVATVANTAPVPAKPLAFTVLAGGTVATVENGVTMLCADQHCARPRYVDLPCQDGSARTELMPGVSCWNTFYLGADVTADGTVLAAILENGGRLGLIRCSILQLTNDGDCGWEGAVTLTKDTPLSGTSSTAVVATPSGGFAVATLTFDFGIQKAQVTLFTCARLDCTQPTTRTLLDVPIEEADGQLRMSVDRYSGALALAYLDPATATLWLGGCQSDCPDGLTLAQEAGWAQIRHGGQDLQLVASPRGPRALITRASDRDVYQATTVYCAGGTCSASDWADCPCWNSVRLAIDRTGQTYVIAGTPTGTPFVANDTDSPRNTLAGRGDVLAATFGPDNRLRLILNGPAGTSLVTCAQGDCLPPCPSESCVWV